MSIDVSKWIGKRIASLALQEGERTEHDERGNGCLVFAFDDGSKMTIFDGERQCCETRYMGTDDDLNRHIGATLVSLGVVDGPTVSDEYGETHEIQFLQVTTSKGYFSVATHNEHNGYYGGFDLQVKEL